MHTSDHSKFTDCVISINNINNYLITHLVEGSAKCKSTEQASEDKFVIAVLCRTKKSVDS